MSERILRVVKDTAPEKSPYQEVFDDGFKEGYARGSQQATEYYSQEIMSLHAQIFELQQERSGDDQPPRLFVPLLRGLIESELRKEGFLEAEIDRRINLIRANNNQPIVVETSDVNEPDLDDEDLWI